eukprot:gene26856-4460_t
MDGGDADACMHPASQDEISYSPQGKKGLTLENTLTHRSAPLPSLPANTQLEEEHTYCLSALQSQPPVQSLIDQQITNQVVARQEATQLHMAQHQKAEQQMTFQNLAQHHSVEQQMPQCSSNSAAQPFMVGNPNGKCLPMMMPRPLPPIDECFSPTISPLRPPALEPLPKQGKAKRHMMRSLSTPQLRNGMSEPQPQFKMLGEQSLKRSFSLVQCVFVPNVDVTTAQLHASTLALAISSHHSTSRLGPDYTAGLLSHLSMPMPHPSLMASDVEDLAMGGFIELLFEEEEGTQCICPAVPPHSLHNWGLPLRTVCS